MRIVKDAQALGSKTKTSVGLTGDTALDMARGSLLA